MKRLTSVEDLRSLQRLLAERQDPGTPTLVVSAGTCGRASGADSVIQAAENALGSQSLRESIRLRVTGCHGFCEVEPSVLVEPRGTFYVRVAPDDMPRIVAAVAQGAIVEGLLFADPATGEPVERQKDIPFFRKQVRSLLAFHERLDPRRIETYVENGGYSALADVLQRNDRAWVIEEVTRSGLRGRGGAGFPTGRKWAFLAEQRDGADKFLVCNGDEGDPGAYMDRSLLEGNPHSIIEGMLIGAFATRATEGVVYIRSEYPLAIEHLQCALRQAREIGLLGETILGSTFSFDITVVRGAGAFVCGEETALIRSIEGKTGEPRQRPPFPVQRGVYGKPTLINNVETWANVPLIIRRGARDFARVGTPNNTGTKIFSLVGKITNTGLVEVPMGMTIHEIVHEIGGGPVSEAGIKAIQTGGPSGGCIPAARFDLPIDYEGLMEAGSMMGSGGMIVMDEGTCMVDLAKYFTNFLKDESCGQCFSCRKGTKRMYEMLNDISRGVGTAEQLTLLEELAQVVKDTGMCGLGQSAPNPVLSTLRCFRDEYLAHIENQRCPAGVCRELITFAINEDCRGCQQCIEVCPADAITGQKREPHAVDPNECVRCGACKTACKFDAVQVS